MIYLRCECGNGIGVPGSFLNEPVGCEDCGRSLRLVAAHDLTDRQSANWRLEVLSAPDGGVMRGEHVLLGGTEPVDVGSGDGKHLRLAGKFVSTDHCRLVPTDDGWTVQDVAGSNGVFVNAQRVASAALRPGDVLRVGGYELRCAPAGRPAPRPVRVDSPPPPPPAARPAAVSAPATHAGDDGLGDYQLEYDLAQAPAPGPPPRPPIPVAAPALAYGRPVPVASLAPAPPCPGCGRTLGPGARICVDCGIDIRTGRPLLTAQGLDEDAMVVRAENTIRVISWVVPLGLYPIGSEARGHAKPYAVWSIAALTVLVSFVFFGFIWTTPDRLLPAGSHLMLWAGSQAAADERSLELARELNDERQNLQGLSPEELAEFEELLGLAARPSQPFQPYQLLTHALLHADLLHLAGNLLFLLVLGTRVNALLGNLKTAIVYPILAVAGAAAHLIASRDEPATPMLGASGAIMGLAGMYLVFFPAYRVHMAAWIRVIFMAFRLGLTFFTVRGFWVVLFYIAFDVVATALGSESGVAHWAHLGGFLAGVGIALLLLLTRAVHAHGGDILSVALGKRAWPLLGRPRPYKSAASVTSSEVTSPAA